MPKPTTTWKSRERQVARAFGAERNPLSGGNSKHTRSDTLHPMLFLEHKHTKSSPPKLILDTRDRAKKEGKIPVVTKSFGGQAGFWVTCHVCDLGAVASELAGEVKA